jgi:hypothetical protein
MLTDAPFAMLASPCSRSITMRIFSSAENCRLVALRPRLGNIGR